ncbi:MAG: GNAT family protein [Chloroflexota bacterium]
MAKTFPELSTERLILRDFVAEDAPAILRIRSDEAVMKTTAMRLYEPDEIVRAEKFIKQSHNKFQRGQFICWAMVTKEENELIGIIFNQSIEKTNSTIEIGYLSAQSAWGKGYMTEAVAGVVSYNFDVFGINRQQAWVFTDNSASSRVLLKNHFRLEGTLRQYIKHPDGTLHDVLMYSRLQSDMA